jgi:hypothetical protein
MCAQELAKEGSIYRLAKEHRALTFFLLLTDYIGSIYWLAKEHRALTCKRRLYTAF